MNTASVLQTLPEWVRNNWFYRADIRHGDSANMENARKPVEASPADANLISSLVVKGEGSREDIHFPILDIDIRSETLPSSTTGHVHLYLQRPLTKTQYEKLLTVLEEVGIIQTGILNQFKRNGATMVRLPHVKKGSPEDAGGFEESPADEGSGGGPEDNGGSYVQSFGGF